MRRSLCKDLCRTCGAPGPARRLCHRRDAYVTSRMPTFYFVDERHTLASALRESLEARCPNELVSCTLLHPLDNHIEVEAPSAAAVRLALLDVKDTITQARRTHLERHHK